MRKSTRQLINRIFEVTAIGLLILNAVVYFAVYKPLGGRVDAAQQQQIAYEQTVRNERVRVELLKKFEAAVPGAGKELDQFTSQSTPSRREAYSTAAHLVHKFADAAGVKVSTMGYHLDPKKDKDPLERLSLAINVQGAYPNLMKFSHALETSNDFILVRGFNFMPGGDTTPLVLRLDADLFLTP